VLLSRLKAQARAVLAVAPERLSEVDAAGFGDELARRLSADVDPAFDRFIAFLGEDYRAAAPDTVGMAQYPGGAEVYAELVRLHTTQELSPEQVHEEGVARMARIEAEMAEIAAAEGHDGRAGYEAALDADPRWRAGTAEEVAVLFQRYIDRMAPQTERYFAYRPEAGCSIAALPAALSGSMTFGYYDAPKEEGDIGRYLFNAENLTRRGLANVGALTFTSWCRAITCTSPPRPRTRTCTRCGACPSTTPSTRAGRNTRRPSPGDRTLRRTRRTLRPADDGRLSDLPPGGRHRHERFGLEPGAGARVPARARAICRRRRSAARPVRYSCDIPAQSLAYKLGDTFLVNLRERMRGRLGERFDVRAFHDAVLRPGALPLPLVAANVDRATQTLAGA
jgi:uncharacterized protein (DUF885 family)